LGEAFGGGGSLLSTVGEGLGAASRWLAFLLSVADLLELSFEPKSPEEVPGTTVGVALAFELRLSGVALELG
jgi:hypothetical protein